MNNQRNRIEKIYPEKMVQKIASKLKKQKSSSNDAITFLNIRLLLCIMVFFGIYLFLPLGKLLAPIMTIIVYNTFEYLMLDLPIQKRKEQLEKEAISFFEILSLTLESQKNLLKALEITTSLTTGELKKEFEKALQEMHRGLSFQECLKNIQHRIPSSTIQHILLNMMESDTKKNNLIENIERQVEYLKEKRYLEQKAKISKIPIRMSVISTIFLIPLITLMIIAPLLLDFLLK